MGLVGNGEALGLGGTLQVAGFDLSDTAISTWRDTGAYDPDYTSYMMLMKAGSVAPQGLWFEGAHSNPATGAVDPTKSTGWVTAGSLSDLDGYRFVRWKCKLDGGSVVEHISINAYRYQ